MGKVLIVEDDDALRRELGRLLELEGFDVVLSDGSGEAGRIASDAIEERPDCIVLDLMLPEADGHSVCRKVRESSSIPVIMLTASDRESDELLGFGYGADDFVTKPYSPAALIARIRALIRRSSPGSLSHSVELNGLTLDLSSGRASYEGDHVDLTRNELRILGALMRSPGAVVTRAELMSELWDSDEFVDDNTLTVNVNRLRSKLSSIGVPNGFIVTRRSMGYQV